jgi:hypothetical protein
MPATADRSATSTACAVARVADLERFEPAGWHCEAIEELRADGMDDDAERMTAVVAVSRVVSVAYAQMCELVAECDPREDDWLREEIACALHVSAFAADQLMVTGRELARRLPLTRAALRAGTIGYDHARRLATGLADLPEEVVARVEPALVEEAESTTPGRLRRAIERAVIVAAPDAAEAAAEAAAKAREVNLYPEPYGMAMVVAHLPAPAALEVFLALDASADRREPGDDRSRSARRADALHGWARDALASGDLPTRHGRPPTVHLTMSVETALGLSDEPAHLAGYGPITAGVARDLAADGEWRALLTDATSGELVRLGQVTYRPGQALRDDTIARYETCTFPSCERLSSACDIDHRTPYGAGGATDAGNCAPLCRRHHRLKTYGGWRVWRDHAGTLWWTSPQRRVHRVRPPTPRRE